MLNLKPIVNDKNIYSFFFTNIPKYGKKEVDAKLPEIAEPSEAAINNILSYSKSLTVRESEMVKTIEVVNQ